MPRDLIPGDVTIRSIKPGDPRKRLGDGDGLYLRLFVKGGAHGWRLDYTINGVRKNLSLGTYPDTGLALARKKANEARALVSAGIDPSEARKTAKAEARQRQVEKRAADAGLPPAGSFEAVAREWLATVHTVKVSTGHAERTRIRLEQDAFPWIGRRPLAEIEAPELLACLRRVEGRGAIETAHRVKDACGQVFRYGIAAGHCTRNPAADLRDALRPVQTRHLAAIVNPDQVAVLLRDVAGYEGHPVTRAALALSALLLLRPGELRQMEWAWVNFDAALLTLPPEVMKRTKTDKQSGPPHLVPLAAQAVTVLTELQPLTGGGRYVFPSLSTATRCMSDNTVRSALRRLGYGNDDMTAHGFRAMARTMIAERLGIAPEVIEAQLAHAVPDALGRAYNRTQYLDQRRQMMTAWADYLDRLRSGAQVLPFKTA
ncbi:MAG: tyrosine-type recombinase/integrase [Leptothrix sp. (in: b-proteobacteria)]